MWEAWEGRHAFQQLPLPMLHYRVVHQQDRPPLPPSCPSAYAQLMQRCWRQDPSARLSAGEVLQVLRDMLTAAVEGGGGSGEGESPRSTAATTTQVDGS